MLNEMKGPNLSSRIFRARMAEPGPGGGHITAPGWLHTLVLLALALALALALVAFASGGSGLWWLHALVKDLEQGRGGSYLAPCLDSTNPVQPLVCYC